MTREEAVKGLSSSSSGEGWGRERDWKPGAATMVVNNRDLIFGVSRNTPEKHAAPEKHAIRALFRGGSFSPSSRFFTARSLFLYSAVLIISALLSHIPPVVSNQLHFRRTPDFTPSPFSFPLRYIYLFPPLD